jgi:hypothetical protein
MAQFRTRALGALTVAAMVATILVAVGQGPVSATHRTGTAVKGSAYGYSFNMGLFGGIFRAGPTPFVSLAPNGSNSPQTANEETFKDGVITAGSPILRSATAHFTVQDQGKTITGPGIPAGTTITSLTNIGEFRPTADSVNLSANATATATGVTFTIVDRIAAIQFGPGQIFSAKGITVQTAGTVGPSWSVTSSADLQDLNHTRIEIFGEDRKDCCQQPGQQWPGDFLDDVPGSPALARPLTDIASTCTASGAGLTGSTTVTNGWLYLHSGWTDYDQIYPEPAGAGTPAEQDPVKVLVPTSPPIGAAYAGHIQLAANSADKYVVVFNEQIVRNGTITVNAAHIYYGYTLQSGNLVVDPGSVLKGEAIYGQSVCGVPHAAPRADFDGNGTTDISVFRPDSGVWFVRNGTTAAWGTPGDIPVPGDYDGNGTTDIAVFRPGSGTWFVRNGTTAAWGASGDIPVPGDYDGDGDTDMAVFRPANGVWFVRGGATVAWGTSGDIPVPGDYDGDGDTDMAVFRPSNGLWFVNGGAATAWGASGDIPVPGDYNGDGRTDIAVFRNGVWLVKGLINATPFGINGDIPVPGDYDDDGDTDLAVFRPSNGTWYVNGGAITPFGTTGDKPAPLLEAFRL